MIGAVNPFTITGSVPVVLRNYARVDRKASISTGDGAFRLAGAKINGKNKIKPSDCRRLVERVLNKICEHTCSASRGSCVQGDLRSNLPINFLID